MYKLFQEIKNINGFIVDKSNLILGDKLKNLSLPKNQIVSNVDTSQPSLQKFENLMVFNSEGKAGVFNFENEEIFILELQSNFYPFLLKDQLLFSYDFQFNSNSYTWKTGLLDTISKKFDEIVFLNSVPILFANSEIQITSENGFLKLYKTLENTFIWQTPLDSYGSIRKVFGVCGNALWIWFDSYRFVALDIHSGEPIEDWLPFEKDFKEGWFSFNTAHFVAKESKVYFFERQYWIELDLQTKNTTILWETSENLDFKSPCFTDEYIYFVASEKHAINANVLGVFSKKDKELIWTYQFVFDSPYTMLNQSPQVANGKLYVLDSGATLHIFEK